MRPKQLPRVPLALALRRRPRLRRALVLAFALLTGLLVQRTVAHADAARSAWGRGRPVAVATRDLEPGHVIVPSDLRLVTLPTAAVPPGALGRQAEGRPVRARILAGEVLHRRRLSPDGLTGVAALLPPGSRALAVPVEPGTAPPLRTGDIVDLVAVVAGDDGHGPRSGVVAAAEVVDVGDRAVTVAVPADAVPRVVAALGAGAVTVALVAP